jgi:hypothetical protein
MCIRANGKILGDYDEPACMLNVTAGHLSSVLGRIDALDEPDFYVKKGSGYINMLA